MVISSFVTYKPELDHGIRSRLMPLLHPATITFVSGILFADEVPPAYGVCDGAVVRYLQDREPELSFLKVYRNQNIDLNKQQIAFARHCMPSEVQFDQAGERSGSPKPFVDVATTLQVISIYLVSGYLGSLRFTISKDPNVRVVFNLGRYVNKKLKTEAVSFVGPSREALEGESLAALEIFETVGQTIRFLRQCDDKQLAILNS